MGEHKLPHAPGLFSSVHSNDSRETHWTYYKKKREASPRAKAELPRNRKFLCSKNLYTANNKVNCLESMSIIECISKDTTSTTTTWCNRVYCDEVWNGMVRWDGEVVQWGGAGWDGVWWDGEVVQWGGVHSLN